MAAGANEVKGHFSRTFVSISRILHAPPSSLIHVALALELSISNIIILSQLQ